MPCPALPDPASGESRSSHGCGAGCKDDAASSPREVAGEAKVVRPGLTTISLSQFDSSPQKTALEREMEDWGVARVLVYRAVHSSYFDTLMGTIIIFNIILMVFEANRQAACLASREGGNCEFGWIFWANRILLWIYTVECMLRFFSERYPAYLASGWNILDLSIVCFGYCSTLVEDIKGLPNINFMRILRVFRLVRAVRLLRFNPELYVMVRGFMGAMKAMWYGMMLIFVLLGVWALIMVEMVNPYNLELYDEEPDVDGCADRFNSVQNAFILLFQGLVAGDSWGTCTIPLIEKKSYFFFFLFALSLVSVTLGFTNLILVAIIEQAQAAREGDKENLLKEKKKAEQASMQTWREVVKSIDADGNGRISFKEMMEGYHIPQVRNTLSMMGIDQMDLKFMFKLMDEDGSGDLDYDEFMDVFLKAQSQDWRVYLMMMKLEITSLARSMRQLQQVSARSAPEPCSSQGVFLDAAKLTAQRGVFPTPGAAFAGQDKALAATDAALKAEFCKMNAYLQEQFEALRVKVELNSVALSRHSEAVKATIAAHLPTLRQQSDLALPCLAGLHDKASPGKSADHQGQPQMRYPQTVECDGAATPTSPPSVRNGSRGSSEADLYVGLDVENDSSGVTRLRV